MSLKLGRTTNMFLTFTKLSICSDVHAVVCGENDYLTIDYDNFFDWEIFLDWYVCLSEVSFTIHWLPIYFATDKQP